MSDTSSSSKSATVAFLLWFFLGGFGAHRFYVGKTGSGLGMLGLAIGSMVLSVVVIGLLGYPVLFVWWLIDAFKINRWIEEPPVPVAGTVEPTVAPTSEAA
ncbi:MAG: TM2 domain-containing protein [Planctomycetota bacterium]|jgi:TM2 domain-containing membrane protein YozV